ncbi:MAG: SGNH/GDSL hydrolase family protein, partial [Bdellovibrionales bacterium]|nr:SGNH/GDSL hydrolase family protein [Bdellovibrionales bacterium]
MEQVTTHTEKEIKLFSRPLIIGASISAGHGTQDGGPGAVLARMINPQAKITNLAFNGASSLQSTAKLNLDNYKPSIVLGLDLFFWDTVREQVGEKFEENTRKLFQQIQARGIPMIIGKIPMVDLPLGNRAESIKKSALKINKLLE